MRICLFLQRRFAYIGHTLALSLQERGGMHTYCGVVDSRESFRFLQKQNDISYAELLLVEDVHATYKEERVTASDIRQYEERLGIPNLWPYIEIDRIIRHGQLVREYPWDKSRYTHEEMRQIFVCRCRALETFLDTNKPDIIITSVVTDLTTLLLFHLAKERNITFLQIAEGRINSRYTLTEDPLDLSFVRERFDLLRTSTPAKRPSLDTALSFLHTFRSNPEPCAPTETPDKKPTTRKKQFSFLLPWLFTRSVFFALRVIVEYITNPYRGDLDIITPWHYFVDHVRRKLRVLIGYEALYDEPAPKDRYAFFPLQYEPEMSLSLFAPFYGDQLWLIKQVARSLPFDMKLYVKEHPAMYGYRPRAFYEELKNIPNVKLLRPTLLGIDLIKDASLVITIAGTAGWEALLLQKPVISFGGIFYNLLPMAKQCRAIDYLPYLVQEQLTKFSYDEEALLLLIEAIFDESAYIDLVFLWEAEAGTNMEANRKAITLFAIYLEQKLVLIANR